MSEYKLDLTGTEWTAPAAGGRSKVIVRRGRQFRVVEMARASYTPHICLLGHLGYVIEGEMRIDFDGGPVTFRAGDGLSVPDGVPHTPHPLTEKVILFLTEKLS